MGETRIGAGTKIDNLVHIAHNVRVGRNCIIVAQVGVAGSTEIGNGVALAGQVGAGTSEGRQHSGIGGHEDFVSGASLESDDRSLVCLPSTVTVGDRVISRIQSRLPRGSIVTTPRHQLDMVVTEHGVADLWGRGVRERVDALIAIADPKFRPELEQAVADVRHMFHEHAQELSD